VPVETPDTTSFLRNALRACAVLFKKVVPFKAELFKPGAGRVAKTRRSVGSRTPLMVAGGNHGCNSRTPE
jgi:hypothetical protein